MLLATLAATMLGLLPLDRDISSKLPLSCCCRQVCHEPRCQCVQSLGAHRELDISIDHSTPLRDRNTNCDVDSIWAVPSESPRPPCSGPLWCPPLELHKARLPALLGNVFVRRCNAWYFMHVYSLRVQGTFIQKYVQIDARVQTIFVLN